MTEPRDERVGTAEALSRLSEDTRLLVRQEIADARGELWERAKELAPAGALLGLGAGLGVAAAASAYRLVLRLLERATSPGVAAFLATGGFAAGAVGAVGAGAARLRAASLPVPTRTLTDAARRAADAVEAAGAGGAEEAEGSAGS